MDEVQMDPFVAEEFSPHEALKPKRTELVQTGAKHVMSKRVVNIVPSSMRLAIFTAYL